MCCALALVDVVRVVACNACPSTGMVPVRYVVPLPNQIDSEYQINRNNNDDDDDDDNNKSPAS